MLRIVQSRFPARNLETIRQSRNDSTIDALCAFPYYADLLIRNGLNPQDIQYAIAEHAAEDPSCLVLNVSTDPNGMNLHPIALHPDDGYLYEVAQYLAGDIDELPVMPTRGEFFRDGNSCQNE